MARPPRHRCPITVTLDTRPTYQLPSALPVFARFTASSLTRPRWTRDLQPTVLLATRDEEGTQGQAGAINAGVQWGAGGRRVRMPVSSASGDPGSDCPCSPGAPVRSCVDDLNPKCTLAAGVSHLCLASYAAVNKMLCKPSPETSCLSDIRNWILSRFLIGDEHRIMVSGVVMSTNLETRWAAALYDTSPAPGQACACALIIAADQAGTGLGFGPKFAVAYACSSTRSA